MERQLALAGQSALQASLCDSTPAPEKPNPFQPPIFLLFVNDPRLLPESYLNFLRARLREKVGVSRFAYLFESACERSPKST